MEWCPAIGLMFAWALMPFVCTPWIRPFRWSRLLWTYLIPIIPLVFLFDGVVSCHRTDVCLGSHAIRLHSMDSSLPLVTVALDLSDSDHSPGLLVRWSGVLPSD